MIYLAALLWISFVWITPAIVAKRMGERKGRASGLALGLLFGWLGVLIVAFLSDLTGESRAFDATPPAAAVPVAVRAEKICLSCASLVPAHAAACRCGFRF